jgi:hypothetical protein
MCNGLAGKPAKLTAYDLQRMYHHGGVMAAAVLSVDAVKVLCILL